MKLILLLTMTAILANCHNPFLTYYRPRFFNPIFRNFNYFRYPYEQFANDPRGDFWVAQPNNPSGELGHTAVESGDELGEARSNHRVKDSQSDDEVSPRFFFNSNQDDAALYRPQIGFNRRTLLYTTTETKTVYTTTNCFAASFFQANAGVCANRRRDVEAQLRRMVAVKKDLETFQFDDGAPSPVETVETTAVLSPLGPDAAGSNRDQATISSSKLEENSEYGNGEIGHERAKRFFVRVTASTFTEWSFTTSTLTQRIGVGFLNSGTRCPPGAGNSQCLLACIPRGFTSC